MSAFDSLIIADSIELLGAPNGTVSQNPACTGAIFQLVTGYDLNAPQPTSDYVGSLILDGERPYGRRASDRTITLPIRITAPDYTTLAAARELLMQTVDQQQWTLKWARDATSAFAGGLGTALPLVLDCFRAQPAVPLWGGPDGYNRSRVAMITLTFQALPYGHSDALVQVPVASPLPGQSAPPSPVVLDTFSSVSGTDFTQDTQFIVGPHSAKWTHGGSSFAPSYVKTGLSANLTGLTALSVYIGFGAAFPATFVNPVTVTFTLTDGTHTLSFSVSRTFTPSDSASVPNFKLVTASIPQGRTFTYSSVTGYSILISSVPAGPSGIFGFGFNSWLDHVVANPPSVQVAGIRGAYYSLLAPLGTARTPISLQVQQPGVTKTDVLSTPGPGLYKAPVSLTGGTASVTAIGGGGAGASLTTSGQGGGGGGGELATEPSLALTAGVSYSYFVGGGGTPQTGITTLAITTASLPSATVSTPYSATLAATGGTPAYTWAHTTGSIPTGLSLNTSTGVISGTPSGSAVSPSLGFTVTDSLGATATAVLVLRVVIATTFAITTTSLPAGSVGGAYSQTLATNGVGTNPLTWSLSSGSLPAGISLGGSTGVISGIPTATGSSTFTVLVTDSSGSPKTDTQVLTLTVTAVSASALPRFGSNSGDNYKNGAGAASNWQAVYNHLNTPGQDFGYRQYGPPSVGMPSSWNDHISVPNDATYAVLSWKPNINSTLAGSFDSQIKLWAQDCQRQWNKNPGSIYMSLWHEADSLSPGTGGNPTSSQVLNLHAYVYPRFKAFAPDVPYGQIFTCAAVKAAPNSWISCKNNPNLNGGSNLDFYFFDGYSHGGNPSAATVFEGAFNNVLTLFPNANLGITEANDYNHGSVPAFWAALWTVATLPKYACEVFMPFFNGTNNGDPICFSTTDSTDPGTNAALQAIVNESAPAGSVPIGSDPPAVSGQATSFTGDSVTVAANGGISATSSSGGTGGTGSTNTTHHNGGAGAAGGTGGGTTPGTPYSLTAVFSAASGGSLSPSIAVTHASAAGDALLAVTSSNSGIVKSMADSKSNKYQNAGSIIDGALHIDYWLATTAADGVSPTVALTTSDHLLPVWAGSGAAQGLISRGVSGISPGTAPDIQLPNTGTGTAVTTGASGVLAQASEWVLMAIETSSTGGTPSSLTGGFTTAGTAHNGSSQELTVADQVVSATTSVTGGATITSTAWCTFLLSIPFAATGANFGGGGGSSAGLSAAGNAGSGATGGLGPDSTAGAGGNGSPDSATPPSNGIVPGGAGGGAASAGSATEGAFGASGQILVSRTTGQEAFSTLIAHMPGPDAPPNLSPLVTFGSSPVTGDGSTEYPVPALVSGVNAGFGGTYSVILVNDDWDSPGSPRTLTVTVNQYEFTGGPVYRTTSSRSVTPVTDDPSGNGIIPIGEITLPLKDVAPDNTACFYTVTITDTDLLDTFLDVMFLDTTGTTVIISDATKAAYQTYYLDAPPSSRDLGRVLATNGTRSSAISVIDQCMAISGGPLYLDPAVSNSLLAYAVEGAPQLGISYFPAWYLDRTS